MYWMYLLWICNFYINFIADLLSFLLASRRSASMDWTAISFPPLVNRSIRQIVSIALDRFFSSPNLFFLFFLTIVSPVRRMFVSCPVDFILLIRKEKIFTTAQVRQANNHNSPRTIMLDCNIHRLKKEFLDYDYEVKNNRGSYLSKLTPWITKIMK